MGVEAIIGVVFTIIGGVIGVLGYKRVVLQDNNEKVKRDARIDAKLDNISKNVDEIRLDNKDFSKSINSLGDRVTKVEESTKQAHKRIDNLEEFHFKN